MEVHLSSVWWVVKSVFAALGAVDLCFSLWGRWSILRNPPTREIVVQCPHKCPPAETDGQYELTPAGKLVVTSVLVLGGVLLWKHLSRKR